MNIWFSWWSAGYAGADSFHHACLRVAAHRARRHHGPAGLITDTPGAKALGACFDMVHTGLDDLPASLGAVWAVGKLRAYQIAAGQGAFLHLDHDFFLQKALPPEAWQAGVLASHPEPGAEQAYRLPWFRTACPWPGRLGSTRVPVAANCGIFGGTDIAAIRAYAQEAEELVRHPANRNFWFERKRYAYGQLSIIVEQAMLAACLGPRLTYLFPGGMPPPDRHALAVHPFGRKDDPAVRQAILSEATLI